MRLVLALLLTACASVPVPPVTPEPTAMPGPLTGQQVIDRLIAAGLEVTDVGELGRPEGMPEHYQFTERLGFTTEGKGGQVYVCETRPHCDLLMEFFRALEAFGGTYYYLSGDGLFIVQLNQELPEETAERFREIVE